jgi:pimeloyl-ACP methyl ester carboxylesterase
LIIFSHANSFPASTYKVLFENLRKRGYTVKAVEKFGHDPLYPVSDNWPHVVQQLLDFAKPLVEKAGEPAWLVGHSLGGFLSLMAAARRPELVKGVVLIDSPILGGWRSKALGLAKTTHLARRGEPPATQQLAQRGGRLCALSPQARVCQVGCADAAGLCDLRHGGA